MYLAYIHITMDYSASYQPKEFIDPPVNDIDLTAEINDRMWDYRQLDQGPRLRPDLTGRPQFTKYSLYHTTDTDSKTVSPMAGVASAATFHASAQRGQGSLFRQTIDVESAIQNRGLVALSHADQAVYVPTFPVSKDGIMAGTPTTSFGVRVVDGQTANTDFASDYLYNQSSNQGRGGTMRAFGIQTRAKNS